MMIDLPLDVLERAAAAFDAMVSSAAKSSVFDDQAAVDAAAIRTALAASAHAANFQAQFDGGDDE